MQTCFEVHVPDSAAGFFVHPKLCESEPTRAKSSHTLYDSFALNASII